MKSMRSAMSFHDRIKDPLRFPASGVDPKDLDTSVADREVDLVTRGAGTWQVRTFTTPETGTKRSNQGRVADREAHDSAEHDARRDFRIPAVLFRPSRTIDGFGGKVLEPRAGRAME